jgi:hypothetical protein
MNINNQKDFYSFAQPATGISMVAYIFSHLAGLIAVR